MKILSTSLAVLIASCALATRAQDPALVEKARQEGSVSVYTSIKVGLWRASGEKIALDEWDKRSRLWSEIFLGGRAVKHD